VIRALASALVLIASALIPAVARADAPALQISVEPMVVQFAVAPGNAASTPVVVRNTGTQPAVVVVTPIDWRTTVDGTVKTERPGSEGVSSLGPELRLSANDFTLEPGESKQMTLALTLPAGFPATARDYWAGYFVRATAAGAPSARSFGVGANILAYETVGPPSRHLKFASLRVTDAGSGAVQLTARLQNDGRTFVRPQIRMTLAQAGRVVQQREDSTPAIFGGEGRLYTRTLRDLAPGAYGLQLTIDYGGATLVEGTTEFTVR
jgi:hypothetical protein